VTAAMPLAAALVPSCCLQTPSGIVWLGSI
jgi:hypothetical protein